MTSLSVRDSWTILTLRRSSSQSSPSHHFSVNIATYDKSCWPLWDTLKLADDTLLLCVALVAVVRICSRCRLQFVQAGGVFSRQKTQFGMESMVQRPGKVGNTGISEYFTCITCASFHTACEVAPLLRLL